MWCGPNSRQVLTFIHAARKIGLVAVPAAYRFTAEELQYLADNSDAVLVVVDAEHADKFAAVRDQLPKVRRRRRLGRRAVRGRPRVGRRVGGPARGRADGQAGGGLGRHHDLHVRHHREAQGGPADDDDPKMTLTLVELLRLQPGNEVHITTGPMYHSGPLAWATLTHLLAGTIVLMRSFDAEEWVDLVREHRVTNTFSAPTQLKRIVSLPPEVLARADLSSMRSLVANAAPVPYALKQEIYEKLGESFPLRGLRLHRAGRRLRDAARGPAAQAGLVRAPVAWRRGADRR